jgi:hypothetical protein
MRRLRRKNLHQSRLSNIILLNSSRIPDLISHEDIHSRRLLISLENLICQY